MTEMTKSITKKILLYTSISAITAFTVLGEINSSSEIKDNKTTNDSEINNEIFLDKANLSSVEKRNIESFYKIVKKKNPESASLIDSIFNSEKFSLDSKVDSIIRGKMKRKIYSYNDYLNVYKSKGVIDNASKFMEENKIPLYFAYERDGVDPRAIVAHIGVETLYGTFLGEHTLANTLATLYTKGSSKKKSFAVQQFNAVIKYAKIKGIDADSLHNIPCSYAGAIGYGQFIPSSQVALFRGMSGNIKDSDPFNMDDAIMGVANFLARNGGHNWNPALNGKETKKITGNRKSSFAYNRHIWYNKVIWDEIVPTMNYRSLDEFRLYAFGDSAEFFRTKNIEFKGFDFFPSEKDALKIPINYFIE